MTSDVKQKRTLFFSQTNNHSNFQLVDDILSIGLVWKGALVVDSSWSNNPFYCTLSIPKLIQRCLDFHSCWRSFYWAVGPYVDSKHHQQYPSKPPCWRRRCLHWQNDKCNFGKMLRKDWMILKTFMPKRGKILIASDNLEKGEWWWVSDLSKKSITKSMILEDMYFV